MKNNTDRLFSSLSRLDLTFSVSDPGQGQVGVRANVTVEIRSLRRRDVWSAIPLTLHASPQDVVRERRGDDQVREGEGKRGERRGTCERVREGKRKVEERKENRRRKSARDS